MPSLLSPSSSSSNSKSYSPLADETTPTFGHGAPIPTITSNGAILYPKRIPSNSSEDNDEDNHRGLKSESEETLSAYPRTGNGGFAQMNGGVQDDGESNGNEEGRKWKRDKGKGKERDWDVERGETYPPVQEDEEEERRIQERLAMLSAKDMARRRAARMSKAMPASPQSMTSARRPMSGYSEGDKRGSLMGLVGGMWGGTKAKERADEENRATTPTHAYMNPYELPMSPSNPSKSPFADPPPKQPRMSHTHSPTSPDDVGFTYGGPGWRGGASPGGRRDSDGSSGMPRVVNVGGRGDKWYHALCAWGEDEEDTGDQAGRTNPFE